jgi:hypothetical protein
MTQEAITPASTPAPPANPARTYVVQGGGAGSAVYTIRDLDMLNARKEQLSSQLSSATERRRSVQKQLQGAVGADKAGLEQRLVVLDARIARLESDIEENGRALASPAAAMVASRHEADRTPVTNVAEHATPILIVFTIFVLMPLAVSISRLLWKRSTLPSRPSIPSETAQRLERMEQAMDAIAIEVERVSEGQRFVTRILTEGKSGAALAAGQPAMQPTNLAAREGLPSPR